MINELDQQIREIRSFTAPSGLQAHQYERIALYDYNDNVIETREQNRDNLEGDNDYIVNQHSYDILDQVVEDRLDSGATNLDIRTQYSYDTNQNLVRKVRGAGTGEESVETWTFDERDIQLTHTRGAQSPESSTTQNLLDANGNLIGILDAAQSDRTTYVHDGYDRKTLEVDRLGNQRAVTYDENANVIAVRDSGPVDGTSNLFIRLAEHNTFFDARNRPYQTDDHVFHYPGLSIGPIDGGALRPGDGLANTITIYDRNNRVVAEIDPDGDLEEMRYDGLGRVLLVRDPLQNEVAYTYDANNNLLSIIDRERSALLNGPEVFVTSFAYDALDRRVRSVEPNGQTTTHQYDSRDNLIRQVDPLGNEIEFRYDRLRRLVDTRKYLSSTGTSASSTNLDTNQGGGDGKITLRQTWDAQHRIVANTDDKGHQTRYTYDDLDRKVASRYADGTVETWRFNEDDEMTQHVDRNGSIQSWQYDAGGRPTRVQVDNSSATASVRGTTVKTWEYDGLGRVTRSTDNNIPILPVDDVIVTRVYDSLSRELQEVQAIPPLPSLTTQSEWVGADRLVAVLYPNGRRVRRAYDGLDRLSEIREDSTGQRIAQFQYVGPTRDLRVTYGSGAVLDKRNASRTQSHTGSDPGYDNNRRHLRHTWQASNGQLIVGYTSTYNGAGGVGTNRIASETRQHLAGEQDRYTFDSTYRMIAHDRAGTLSSRSLDGLDKMTAFIDEGIDRQPIVDGNPTEAGVHQYSSFDGRARTYDDNGNMIADGSLRYFYDFENRLVEVQSNSGVPLAINFYDAEGRRAVRLFAGAIGLRYAYKGWSVVEERTLLNIPIFQYVDGRTIDEHIQVKTLFRSGHPEYYYHCNSQGIIGALTDSSEQVVEYYTYSWLGKPTFLDASGAPLLDQFSQIYNFYLFQGRRYDIDTGQYYYRTRFYSPEVGEFLSERHTRKLESWAGERLQCIQGRPVEFPGSLW